MIRLLPLLLAAVAVAGCHITPRAADELAHRQPGLADMDFASVSRQFDLSLSFRIAFYLLPGMFVIAVMTTDPFLVMLF